MTREELIQVIAQISPDIVVVGGSAQVYHGKKETAKDIDIVVKSLVGFHFLGHIHCWKTTSPFSKSGKRAFIRRPDCNIDIFIENDLPKHVITDGVKYETVSSMIKFYKRVYNEYDELKQWKQRAEIKSKHDAISIYPL